MATENQLKKLDSLIKTYRRKYLRKEFSNRNEADTRIMTNSFLTEVLGYQELEEIKTEYRVKGEYADYVIQLKRKKHFIVEVKSIELDLSEKHMRQSLAYAANEGIDWVLLMNGRDIHLYRVNFGKPVSTTKIFEVNLLDSTDLKKAPELIWNLTKYAVEKGDLEAFWKRSNALEPSNLARLLYSEEIVKRLRADLKDKSGIYFQVEDVAESLREVIVNAIEFPKPRLRVKNHAAKPSAKKQVKSEANK